MFEYLSPTVTKSYFDNKEVSYAGNANIVSTTGPFYLHLSHLGFPKSAKNAQKRLY